MDWNSCVLEALKNNIISQDEFHAMNPKDKEPGRFYCNFKVQKGPTSQPQSTLSRWKNLPPLIKILTPPNFGSQKTVLIIAFRIALTLDVQIVWFDC